MHQFVVQAFLRDEVIVTAFLQHHAVIHDDDVVGVCDGREAMCNRRESEFRIPPCSFYFFLR